MSRRTSGAFFVVVMMSVGLMILLRWQQTMKPPAVRQPTPREARIACREIGDQLAALKAGNFDKAYTYLAGPAPASFGVIEGFRITVNEAPLFRTYTSYAYGKMDALEDGSQVRVLMYLRGSDGGVMRVLYDLERLHGTYKITGFAPDGYRPPGGVFAGGPPNPGALGARPQFASPVATDMAEMGAVRRRAQMEAAMRAGAAAGHAASQHP